MMVAANSGAELPAAMNVAPATSGCKFRTENDEIMISWMQLT